MNPLELFLQNNNLKNDPEDLDSLLECASAVRELIAEKQYQLISRVVCYTVENSFYEAFSWTVQILQEEFEKEECTLQDFTCEIGGNIPDFDGFVQILQIDFNPCHNYIEKIYDSNGEVESFFNVSIYKTAFEHIYLLSAENFDTRDNDFIQYKLSFVRDTAKQC